MSTKNDDRTPEEREASNPITPKAPSAPRKAAMNNPFPLESAAEALRAEQEEARYAERRRKREREQEERSRAASAPGTDPFTPPKSATRDMPRAPKGTPPKPNPFEKERDASRTFKEETDVWAKRTIAELVKEIDALDVYIFISPEIREGKNLEGIAFIMGGRDMDSSASWEESVYKMRFALRIAKRRREDLEAGKTNRRRLEADPGRLFTTVEWEKFSQR